MITIKYQPRLADQIHAARTCDGYQTKRMRLIAGPLIIAFGIVLTLYQWYVWGGLCILIGILDVFNLLPAAVVVTLVGWRANPKFKEQHEITFTAEGMHFQTPSIDSTIKWTHYSKCLETRRAFVMIYGKRMYSAIPKRAFSSPEQITEFRSLLATVFGSRSNR